MYPPYRIGAQCPLVLEKIEAEAIRTISKWMKKHSLVVTSLKGREEGRKSLQTYNQLVYLFFSVPSLSKDIFTVVNKEK